MIVENHEGTLQDADTGPSPLVAPHSTDADLLVPHDSQIRRFATAMWSAFGAIGAGSEAMRLVQSKCDYKE
jgi:hypothetical protein